MRALPRLLCLLLITGLAACGYQLRGQGPENDAQQPLTRLAIDGDNRYQPVAAEVRRLAEARNIAISDDAGWAIRIGREQQSEWRASTSRSYSQNEYWISLSSVLTVRHQSLEYQPIPLKRQLLFQDDSDRLTSKAHEKQLIIEALRKELAEEILQQVTHLANNPPCCHAD